MVLTGDDIINEINKYLNRKLHISSYHQSLEILVKEAEIKDSDGNTIIIGSIIKGCYIKMAIICTHIIGDDIFMELESKSNVRLFNKITNVTSDYHHICLQIKLPNIIFYDIIFGEKLSNIENLDNLIINTLDTSLFYGRYILSPEKIKLIKNRNTLPF